MKKFKNVSIYPDPETLYKLHYVAASEGRSLNKHVLYLVHQNIRAFEAEHGKIEPPEEPAAKT